MTKEEAIQLIQVTFLTYVFYTPKYNKSCLILLCYLVLTFPANAIEWNYIDYNFSPFISINFPLCY